MSAQNTKSLGGIRKLPPFEQTIGAVLLEAKEAVIVPLRPILREYNITEPQWRVMRVISDRTEIDATIISGVGLLRAPSVTRILKELEARKLISRKVDEDDRRRALIVLSSEGRELVKVVSRRMVQILREYSTRFGRERLDRLTDELRALSAAIKSVR